MLMMIFSEAKRSSGTIAMLMELLELVLDVDCDDFDGEGTTPVSITVLRRFIGLILAYCFVQGWSHISWAEAPPPCCLLLEVASPVDSFSGA